ncbi:hypothetical protein DFH06DRAFT_1146505 [Mycena polygramma]|nr:hypothetical protein DFH06DRAFT_1146505 [Mycena polygramma]
MPQDFRCRKIKTISDNLFQLWDDIELHRAQEVHTDAGQSGDTDEIRFGAGLDEFEKRGVGRSPAESNECCGLRELRNPKLIRHGKTVRGKEQLVERWHSTKTPSFVRKGADTVNDCRLPKWMPVESEAGPAPNTLRCSIRHTGSEEAESFSRRLSRSTHVARLGHRRSSSDPSASVIWPGERWLSRLQGKAKFEQFPAYLSVTLRRLGVRRKGTLLQSKVSGRFSIMTMFDVVPPGLGQCMHVLDFARLVRKASETERRTPIVAMDAYKVTDSTDVLLNKSFGKYSHRFILVEIATIKRVYARVDFEGYQQVDDQPVAQSVRLARDRAELTPSSATFAHHWQTGFINPSGLGQYIEGFIDSSRATAEIHTNGPAACSFVNAALRVSRGIQWLYSLPAGEKRIRLPDEEIEEILCEWKNSDL